MSVTQVNTPTSIDTYATLFAQNLLDTEPRTQDHLNALDAYLLATLGASQEADTRHRPLAENLNADYLRRLSEAALDLGAAVMVPSIEWDHNEWNRWARIGQASLVIPGGFDTSAWSNVFMGIVSGEVTIQDERRYDRISAFVRIGRTHHLADGA